MIDVLNAIVLFSNFVLIPGLAYGSQLALGALGVTLIYAVLRFSNFAHGDLMAFGAMCTILVTWLLQEAGITAGVLPTALLGLPFGILGAIAISLVFDRTVYRFYRAQRSAPVVFVIASVGVMFMLNGLVRHTHTHTHKFVVIRRRIDHHTLEIRQNGLYSVDGDKFSIH